MRRALISTLALTGAGIGVVPVLAAPPVDAGSAAGISVDTTLPDGDTLTLDITATQLSSGPHLTVEATRCDRHGNCSTQPYSSALPAGALTISSSSARLDTPLDGRSLVVTWTTNKNGYLIGAGSVDGGGAGAFGTDYAGTMADTIVSYDGHQCTGVGGVGNGVLVDTSGTAGDPQADPVSALRLPDDTAFRC